MLKYLKPNFFQAMTKLGTVKKIEALICKMIADNCLVLRQEAFQLAMEHSKMNYHASSTAQPNDAGSAT